MKILYHYCSNETFLSIVENRSIWLSSLSLSNDSMEGKLAGEIIRSFAKQDNLDKDIIKDLSKFTTVEKQFDCLGFCLSQKGDLLSQWRGYANDASGISIGFSKEYLKKFSNVNRSHNQFGIKLKKVKYDKQKQRDLLKPEYTKFKKCIDDGAFQVFAEPLKSACNRDKEEAENMRSKQRAALAYLAVTSMMLIKNMFLLKAKAFSEEKEWRLISFGKKKELKDCLFRVQGEKIITYREIEVTDFSTSPILKVIIGPKNPTPVYIIENILRKNGFESVEVLRSKLSYQ